jgi:hypothetical protein
MTKDEIFALLPDWALPFVGILFVIGFLWQRYWKDIVLSVLKVRPKKYIEQENARLIKDVAKLERVVEEQNNVIRTFRENISILKEESTSSATVATMLVGYIKENHPDSEILKSAQSVLRGEK